MLFSVEKGKREEALLQEKMVLDGIPDDKEAIATSGTEKYTSVEGRRSTTGQAEWQATVSSGCGASPLSEGAFVGWAKRTQSDVGIVTARNFQLWIFYSR